MHVRYPCPSLHYLQYFSLLQDAQKLIIGTQFVLLSLHKQALRCLSVNTPIEQMLVLPLNL